MGREMGGKEEENKAPGGGLIGLRLRREVRGAGGGGVKLDGM